MDREVVEWIDGERGNQKLAYEGFLFNKHRTVSSGTTVYECEHRKAKRCPAKVRVNGENIEKQEGEHNHAPDVCRIHALKAKACMKRQALSTAKSPHAIISDITSAGIDTSSPRLPAVSSMRRQIRRYRQKVKKAHRRLPTSTIELAVPEKLQSTTNGEEFLICDSETGSVVHRMVILSTKENLELLNSQEYWNADGTFKVAPKIFFRGYSTPDFNDSKQSPCIYAALPNKEQATYECMLQKTGGPEDGLQHREPITADFETAVIKAFQN